MDRWSGILKVPLYANSSTVYRVGASLCLSTSTRSLAVPSANAIFFCGDRVDGTGNSIIERLSDLGIIADILVSKFGSSVNAWVVQAATFNGPFAVYKEFIPSVNEYGEPKSYDATGFPASTSTVLLLSNCLKEAKRIISDKGKEPFHAEVSSSYSCKPKTYILGFSKGGIVLNQLVTELGLAEVEFTQSIERASKKVMNGGQTVGKENLIIPSSKNSLLNSIAEIHYVDVGLNSDGAYLNNRDVIDRISERLKHSESGMCFVFHGTPRQWCDGQRIWIVKEKDELVRLLKEAARRNMGKLFISEKLYFAGTPPNLQMHFEIIEKLDVSC